MSDPADFSRVIKTQYQGQSAKLDCDPSRVQAAIQQIMAHLLGRFPTEPEMDTVFEISPCLGFTLMQHFGALGLLCRSKAWIDQNLKLWPEIVAGRHLVGLASTHLYYAKPSDARLENGRITGRAPWSSGYEIFDSYLLGCRDGDEILLIHMPYQHPNTEIRRIELAALNGTSSIGIQFSGATFSESAIVSRHSSWPPQPTEPPSVTCVSYVSPFLGIVQGILADVESELGNYSGVRKSKFTEAYNSLMVKFQETLAKRGKLPEAQNTGPRAYDDLQFEVGELARQAVRLLTLICGGSSLVKNSLLSRRQLEILLFDALSSSEYFLDRKLNQV